MVAWRVCFPSLTDASLSVCVWSATLGRKWQYSTSTRAGTWCWKRVLLVDSTFIGILPDSRLPSLFCIP